MGALDLAILNLERGLAIKAKLLGSEHLDVATSYNNIGTLYQAQDNLGRALEYFEKAVAIWEKVLGKGHLDTAMTYNNMGMIYYRKGDVDRALQCLEHFSEILEKHFGPQHPQVLATKQGVEKLQKEQQQQTFTTVEKKNQIQCDATGKEKKDPVQDEQEQESNYKMNERSVDNQKTSCCQCEASDSFTSATEEVEQRQVSTANDNSTFATITNTSIDDAKQSQDATRARETGGNDICCLIM
jgi:tetratricopeptide (TPR) repeat protein